MIECVVVFCVCVCYNHLYKLKFIVLFVFLCRGRVPRPAGGETPPLQGLTEFVICTDNFRFVELIIETKIKYISSNRFTFSEAVFLCSKLKGDVNVKYVKNTAK